MRKMRWKQRVQMILNNDGSCFLGVGMFFFSIRLFFFICLSQNGSMNIKYDEIIYIYSDRKNILVLNSLYLSYFFHFFNI